MCKDKIFVFISSEIFFSIFKNKLFQDSFDLISILFLL